MRGSRGSIRGRGRGGFANRGRQVPTAQLRMQVLNREQMNSARRLQKDLHELENAREPLVGVTAKPLPNDMYTWHGNLRGPAGTKWAEGVFHFVMTIPKDYPSSPPDITLSTPIPHPNVFGTKICLDMLGSTRQIYQGWVPAYTIEAVLIQLQSFLFEKLPEDIETTKNIRIGQAIKEANDFICPVSKHRGPLQPSPPFYENEKNVGDFIMVKTPKQLLGEELVCFTTKMTLREGTLGIGISLKKSPRTGKIMFVNPTMDLMNMRSFVKLKIRRALAGERFTHFLPLYFGETEKYETEDKVYDEKEQDMVTIKKHVDMKERFEAHLKKSMAFITNGDHHKGYTTKNVLEFMPTLIITHIVDLMKDNRHVSIIAIRRVVNFIRLYQYLMAQDSKLQEEMDGQIELFLADSANRHKSKCSSLGNLQVFATMSSKFKYQDILEAYVEEQLDRQVLWILKEIPELDFEAKKMKGRKLVSEKERKKVSFAAGKTGFYLTMFFHQLNQAIEKVSGSSPKNMDQLAKCLDDNFGCLDMKIENELQQRVFDIMKIEDFITYYRIMGIDVKTDEDLHQRLVKAVKNSRQKGYHGQDCKANLPSMQEQSFKRVEALVSQFATLDVEKLEVKKDLVADDAASDTSDLQPVFMQHIKSIKLKDSMKNANDEAWKKLCIANFDFVRIAHESNKDKKVSAAKLAKKHDEMTEKLYIEDLAEVKKTQDKLALELRERKGQQKALDLQSATTSNEYDEKSFTYRKLMIKLAFELIVGDLPYSQEFEMIYEFLKAFSAEIETVLLSVINKEPLKSNNYWLMAILPKLKNLKVLKFQKPFHEFFGVDGFKFLQKAFTYFAKNGGSLTEINFSNFQNTSHDHLYGCLKTQPNLQVLNFSSYQLSIYDLRAIGKILSEFKNIKELNLSKTNLNMTMGGKEIADGMMRAKQLEIVKLDNNSLLDPTQIIYNLAFSPKIRHLDITNVAKACTSACAEAIYKLLSISGSITTLLMGGMNIVDNLQEPFYQALGESKTLEHLVLDKVSGQTSALLAKAVAMNKKKEGVLTYLSIRNGFQTSNKFEQMFCEKLLISDQEEEQWYGDQKTAREMKGEQLVKKFYCGLEFIDVTGSSMGSTFKIKNFERYSNTSLSGGLTPKVANLFCHGESALTNLSLRNCKIHNEAMEIYSYLLGQNKIAECSKLRVLDLSQNKIASDGAKQLALSLETNKSVEFLDLSQNHLGVYGAWLIANSLKKNKTLKGLNLFKNTIDVDGARALRELIKVNSTLEFLDIGHNRIRSKGLEAITEGIQNAKSCNIKSLGLRLNFINDDGFSRFFDESIFSGMSKIENLYISQNNLTEYKSSKIIAKLKQKNQVIYVDQFEKNLYLDEQRMENTLWIGPIDNKAAVQRRFLMENQTGLVKRPIRFRQGKKVPGKAGGQNIYMFVEFEDEASCPIFSKKVNKGTVGYMKKAYKAGTNTYVHIRRSKRK